MEGRVYITPVKYAKINPINMYCVVCIMKSIIAKTPLSLVFLNVLSCISLLVFVVSSIYLIVFDISSIIGVLSGYSFLFSLLGIYFIDWKQHKLYHKKWNLFTGSKSVMLLNIIRKIQKLALRLDNKKFSIFGYIPFLIGLYMLSLLLFPMSLFMVILGLIVGFILMLCWCLFYYIGCIYKRL